jgi:TPP-dependent pyruvate/acetoin dehydrogenase alpha subunit
MLEPGVRRQIEGEVEREIPAAFAFAEESPFPQGPELFTDVFLEKEEWSAPSLT